MKTNSKIMILAALAGFLASSCGNENNTPDPSQEQGITFSFEEQNYETDQELTRSVPRTETINLGDCEAEVSVENDPDTAVNKTRAITNKHYTIRAYQGSVKKGEIKGTFNGTKFTADSNSPQDLILEQGQTYDFVAFNDDVTPSSSGEELTVSIDNVGNAYIGRTTATITQAKKQQIAFEMKHVGARLRTRFLCQKHIPNNITATLSLVAASNIPVSMTNNPVTQTQTYTQGTMTPQVSNSPASTEALYTASNGGQTFAYTSTSNYHYFLPSTEGSKLKLTFNAGTVFWKPITGDIPKLNATLSMQQGKSYLVKIKLKPKFSYLFSDGTWGTLSANPGKTPIGVVVKENNGTPNSGLAMALHNANNGNGCAWGPTNMAGNKSVKNHGPSSYDSGYNLTWRAASSYYNIVKANSGSFPAFYYAAQYYPGVTVTGTNIGKWFLPGGRDIDPVMRNLYWGAGTPGEYGTHVWGYGVPLDDAIKQVGGTAICDNSKAHWVATEGANVHWDPAHPSDFCNEANFRQFRVNGIYFSYTTKNNSVLVRPFVYF